MNTIYIESKTLLENKQAVEWLDGCGVKWAFSREKFTEFKNITQPLIEYAKHLGGFVQCYKPFIDSTHTPTALEFCQGVARILGIPEPTFGEPKGMGIEVSRLSEEDKEWLSKALGEEFYWEHFAPNDYLFSLQKSDWLVGPLQIIKKYNYTITDSPTEFLEYVARQIGKEYRVNSEADKCMECGNPLGYTPFTVCDNCWDVGKKSQDISSYPHKTYRILDSLDGIPLDTRIPLSEWIPPIGSRVLVIGDHCEFIGDMLYVGKGANFQTDYNAVVMVIDCHWMRIV